MPFDLMKGMHPDLFAIAFAGMISLGMLCFIIAIRNAPQYCANCEMKSPLPGRDLCADCARVEHETK